MTLDEQDLRSGLRALSRGVPPAPPARAELAVRRSVRIRRGRVAMAGALVVALAAPIALIASGPAPRESRPTGTTATATPVIRWPDRRDPEYHTLSERAVAAYASVHSQINPGEQARHLWAGAIPETDYIGAAFAFCGADDCSLAILMASPKDVLENDPTDWVRTVVRGVRDGQVLEPLSMLVPAEGAGVSSPSAAFVVGPPGSAEVTWESPSRLARTGGRGTLRRRDAVFAGDVGWLSAPVVVRITDENGHVLGTGTVGDLKDRTGVGNNYLRDVSIPAVPTGMRSIGSGVRQIGPQNSGWNPIQTERTSVPYAVVVRCLGTSPIRVFNGEMDGEVPCDGVSHRIDSTAGARFAPDVRVTGTDPYAVYALVFVIAAPPG